MTFEETYDADAYSEDKLRVMDHPDIDCRSEDKLVGIKLQLPADEEQKLPDHEVDYHTVVKMPELTTG